MNFKKLLIYSVFIFAIASCKKDGAVNDTTTTGTVGTSGTNRLNRHYQYRYTLFYN